VINTEWKIGNLERSLPDEGVVVAHWNCVSTEGEFSSRAYGTVSFTPDPTKAGYIPFDQLTEEVVIGWVKESMQSTREIPAVTEEQTNEETGETTTVEITPASTDAVDGAADIEANLAEKIETQKNPTTASGCPWNNPVAEAA